MRALAVLSAILLSSSACTTAKPAVGRSNKQNPALLTQVSGLAPSMGQILEKSPASDWRTIDPGNTLYMEMPAGRIVIELAPTFAPNHVKNIKALLKEHYFDGAFIVRSQDNYVAQWGWPDDMPHKPKHAKAKLKAEFDGPLQKDLPFTALSDPDSYAPKVGFTLGFPVAMDESLGKEWLAHCYGMVGVGRDLDADSGNGGELYAVNGHSPRHLDRNVTLVGRIVQGMELLSVLPRGTGDLGFYKTAAERTQIKSIELASDVPPAERTDLEALKTDSMSFAALIQSRRSRHEDFFKVPTDHIGLCNVPLPVRAAHK